MFGREAVADDVESVVDVFDSARDAYDLLFFDVRVVAHADLGMGFGAYVVDVNAVLAD